MKKRIVALLLTFVMAVGLLAGCTPSTPQTPTAGKEETKAPVATNAPSETPTEAPEVSAYPIVDEPITIKMAVVGRNMTNPSRLLYERLAELTNINIEIVNIEKDQFNVYLASNDWPDFFLEGLDANTVYEYGVLGQMLVNYQDKLDIMPNLAKVFEDFPTAYKTSVQEDGGIYALPRVEYSATLPMTRIHYNAEFFEKHNLEEPTTLDEFYDLMVKIRDINDGAAPLAFNLTNETQYLVPFLLPVFGEYGYLGFCVGEDGVVVDSYATEQYREFLKFMHKMYDEGLIDKEYLTMDDNARLGLVQEGTGVLFGKAALSVTADMFSDGQYHFGVLTPPVMNEGDTPRCLEIQPVKSAYSFAINANSPYVDEICKWIDIAFANEEVAEGTGLYGVAFSYGPVGETFHFTDEGTYYQTAADGVSEITSDYKDAHISIGWFGLCDIHEYIGAGGGSVGQRAQGYRDKVLPYCTIPNYPSVIFSEEENQVRDQYLTEQQTYKKSMYNKFIMGVEDINDDATWQNYLDMMKTYKTDELVKVYQEAYDRYMSN